MIDLKTTITGVVTGIISIMATFNIIVPDTWTPVIVAIGVALIGIFAKDSKKAV